MPLVGQTGGRRDVPEPPTAEVFQKHISLADRRHHQVGVPIVIDICKGCRDADPVADKNPRQLGDVAEFPTTEVAPEFAAACLIHKIDVQAIITIHIRHRYPRPMIIMHPLVGLAGIICDFLPEGNAAGLPLIGKGKFMEGANRLRRVQLGALPVLQPPWIPHLCRHLYNFSFQRGQIRHQLPDGLRTLRIIDAADSLIGIHQQKQRAVVQASGTIPTGLPRQLETLPADGITDLRGRTSQELPNLRVGPSFSSIGLKHFGDVFSGIHAETHEAGSFEARVALDPVLDALEQSRLRGADCWTAGEHEVGNPWFPRQAAGGKTSPLLVCQSKGRSQTGHPWMGPVRDQVHCGGRARGGRLPGGWPARAFAARWCQHQHRQ